VALPRAAEQLRDGVVAGGPGRRPAAVAAAVADGVAQTAALLAAPAGLVLVLDDLQWADPASLELLALLGPRLASERVLLVVTVRHLEVGRDDAVVAALAQITRYPGRAASRCAGLTLPSRASCSAGPPVSRSPPTRSRCCTGGRRATPSSPPSSPG
jgi:hypothetical protein